MYAVKVMTAQKRIGRCRTDLNHLPLGKYFTMFDDAIRIYK
jgi:hypothetical protein